MRHPIQSSLAGALALVLAANAAAMLFASVWWYGAVPGVVATGAYNAHFIKDVGAAYLVVAGSLAAFAWRPELARGALVASTGFLILHGFIHIADALASPVCGRDLVRDFPGVFLPALIGLGLCAASLPKQKEPLHA